MLASTFHNMWSLCGTNTTPLSYMTIQRYVPCHVLYDSSNMTLNHLVICVLYDYNIVIDRVIYFLFSYSDGIQIKNSFDEILSLSFDLGPLKMNNNVSNKSQICKGLSKGFI